MRSRSSSDGTLGPIRRAELERHLDECAELPRARGGPAGDPRRHGVARAAGAARPRVAADCGTAAARKGASRTAGPADGAGAHAALLAIAAALVLAVGASIVMLRACVPIEQRGAAAGRSASPQPGNAAPTSPSKALRRSSGSPSSTTRTRSPSSSRPRSLDQASADQNAAIDPQTAAMLQKNLQVIDQAIAESRAALRNGAAERAGARQSVRRAETESRRCCRTRSR